MYNITQEQILNFLEKNSNKWFTREEICLGLKVDRINPECFNRLANSGFVYVDVGINEFNKIPFYRYRIMHRDEFISNCLIEIEKLKSEFPNLNREMILDLLVLKELRRLQNGK